MNAEDTKEVSRGVAIAVVIAIIVVVLGIGVWAFNVVTSGVKGQGDAQIKKNSAENWPRQQAEFQRLYNSIKTQDKNITIAWKELQADPKNQVKQTNYSGQVRNCNDTVGNYNSKAQEYLAKDFRDANLPAQIDQTDPATDCKEDQ